MRLPRVRFTIRRLMITVLVLGLTLGLILPRLQPSVAEQQAQAAYLQARLTREVAEYAVTEYLQGIYPQEKATSLGLIAMAKSDLDRATDRLKWSTKMSKQGRVPAATSVADALALQKADFDLEQAETQWKVLQTYTRDKQVKALTSDVEKARAIEKSARTIYIKERAERWGIFGF